MATVKTKRRRQRGEGSIYQRPDGMWCAQIDLGYAVGKRRRKTLYASTQQGVVKKLRDARKAIDAGDISTSSMRVDKWLRYWVTEIAPQSEDKPLKPKTLVDYRSKIERYLVPTIGHHKLDKLNAQHLREMHKQLRAMKTDDGKPLSATTIHHAHRVLSNALAAAMREVGLTRNMAKTVPAPAKAVSRRRSLSVPEVKAILTVTQGDPMTFTRRLASFLTGARQGELLGLRWEYVTETTVDLAWSLQRVPYRHGCLDKSGEATCGKRPASCPRRELDINPALEYERIRGNLCLLRPKTAGSKRVVPLVPPLPEALELLRANDPGPNPHGFVWHRPDGMPFNAKEDWTAWGEAVRAAGVPATTLHEARHSTVTLLTNLGVDERIIANIVGHSDVLTQAGYRHRNLALEAEALSRLGQVLALD